VVLGKLGLAIRRLGRDDMREFLRLMLMNIADVLDEEIADDRIKGAVAFDAIIGTHLGPLSPGSLMTYLYRIAGEVGGRSGAFCLPKGGMGTVVHALTLAARQAGAELRAGTAVTRIAVANGRATGVILADGSTLEGRTIVSAANPRTTLMELVGARELDTDIVRRLENIRMAGNAAKLHLALDALPDFTGVADKAQPARLLIAPSVRAVETAFNPAKYGAFSAEPVMEIVIPTCADPSLAPAGKHVLSAIVHYAPYRLKEGWITGKPKLLEACLATLERYAPGLRTLVLHAELLTPADIESRYRMPGGHWHHGELAIDQMFMLRPFQQVAQYATPIEGLWLAGAGSHPGGNVMGLAGLNAARAIIAAEKRR
jgi:phytoene dehydrogenase-like protein